MNVSAAFEENLTGVQPRNISAPEPCSDLEAAIKRSQDYLLSVQYPEGYWVGELMVDSTLVSDTVSFDRWANQAGTGIIANMRAGNITSVHTQNIWRHRGATLDIARGPNVLFADGQDLRHLPLAARKAILDDLLHGRNDIVVLDGIAARGVALFRKVCEFDLEGPRCV